MGINGRARGMESGARGVKGMFAHKKAISVWISWTLLVTFVIFLGTTVFYWMKDFSVDAMDDLKDRVETSEKCDLVSIELSDVVSKNAQTLNIKVTNRYNLGVNRIVFDLYDQSNTFIWQNITNSTIKPNSTKTIEVPQNSSVVTGLVKATPVIISGDKEIYCTERLVEANVSS